MSLSPRPLRFTRIRSSGGTEPRTQLVTTTFGRALFNEALPSTYRYVNHEVKKGSLGEIIDALAERYTKVEVAETLDALKEKGFYWATRAGVSISFADVVAPKAKDELLKAAEAKADTARGYAVR